MRSVRLLALVLGCSLPVALAADAPAPPGRAYAAAELDGLLEGLGYPAAPSGARGRAIRVARADFYVDVNVFVSEDGSQILLYAPVREWKDEVRTAPEEVLLGMLRRSAELAPTRFYVSPVGDAHWVGLLRSLDNRAVRPLHVRENLDALFDHVRATEDLWNPRRWVTPPTPTTPAKEGGG